MTEIRRIRGRMREIPIVLHESCLEDWKTGWIGPAQTGFHEINSRTWYAQVIEVQKFKYERLPVGAALHWLTRAQFRHLLASPKRYPY